MRRAVSLRRILSSQWPARRFKDLSAISPPFDQLLGKAKGFSLRRCTVKTAIRICPLRRDGDDLPIHILDAHRRTVEQYRHTMVVTPNSNATPALCHTGN